MDLSNIEWDDTENDPPNRFASKLGFNERIILITGGTGFLGKVGIEKLLRTCPKIGRVYLLVRPKKGKTAQQRLAEIFAGPLYDLLRETRGPDIFNKVVAISGDCELLDLGLSPEDRETLLEEVQGVLHMAATIRFDEPLKKTVLLNTRGTKLLLDLAKQMRNLIMFVYMSTAYCHLEEKVLFEKAYPPPADPHRIINLVETLDDEAVNKITKKIIGSSPNTYVFSKALAESLVVDEMENMKCAIIRPSLVIPIWREPLPGWSDNLNGAPGIFLAAGKGILRTIYCQPDGYADFIPADIAANAVILAVGDVLVFGERRFYNLTSSSLHKITWAEVLEMGRRIIETKYPANWVVWYPGGSLKTSRFLNAVCVVIFHYIPAILVDALIILTLNKPVLWNIQRRISKGMEVFDYFINNHWEFNNEQSMAMRDLLNDTERRIYKVDDEGLDYEEYFTNAIHAGRLYLLKDGDDTLPTARRHMKVMWVVDKITRIIFGFGLLYVVLKYIIGPMFGTDLF